MTWTFKPSNSDISSGRRYSKTSFETSLYITKEISDNKEYDPCESCGHLGNQTIGYKYIFGLYYYVYGTAN